MPHPIRATWLTRPGWSEFGAWRKSGGHKGFDYYAPEGTPIYGTGEGGRVVHIGYNMDPVLGFGHSVRIEYPGSRVTVDAHMRSRTPLNVGDSVGIDTIVGYVGKTGNAFRTIWNGLRHVHHEVTVRGVLVDPIALYDPALAGDDGTPIPTEQDDDMKIIAVPAGSIGLIGGHGEPVVFTNYATQGFLIEALVAAYGKVTVTPDQFTTHINFQKAQAKVNRQVDVAFDADRAAASIGAALLEQNGMAPSAGDNAAAIVRALGPEFEAIAGDVVDELKTRL